MKTSLGLVLIALMLNGCSWAKFDAGETYLKAKTVPRVKIPDSLDKPDFQDAMVVPPIDDARKIAGKKLELGLPDTINTSFGVDKIVIKKLGDNRWVFLDAPPATVWPKVRQFWEEQHIPLASADPSQGIMETEWLYAKAGTPKEIFESIGKGLSATDADVATMEKFRLRVEPGIRAGSTEIYLEEKSAPVGVPVRESSLDWKGKSDNGELEGVVLSSVAYYLGDHINSTYAVSKGAENIGGEKARLIPDRVKPVLAYKLPFDRAWATVGDALDHAKISVEDMDRSAANYYVYFNGKAESKPGFLSRLLFHGGKSEEQAENRYLVHLDSTNEEEVNVTVMKDPKTLASPDVAEKLLKIIKAYST